MIPQHVCAKIVVGMPVYNAETTVSDAIASVLAYPYDDLKLLISDNASTDETQNICRRFAARDDRVELVTQSRNIGAEANFDYVLSAAQSRYFMWAAGDDVRSPNFLESCATFLDTHEDYVGATCPVRFKGAEFDPRNMGDRSIELDDPHERMLAFLTGIHANGRFYSLLRRSALDSWLGEDKNYLGADWALVIRLLRLGKFARLETGFVELGAEGASNKPTIFARYRRRTTHWAIPFLDLSWATWREFRDARNLKRVRLLLRLMKLNTIAAAIQVRYELLLRTRKPKASQ